MTTSGWTFGKVTGVILGVIGFLCFGSCTLIGPFFLHNPPNDRWKIAVAAGALMTLLSVWLVVAMIRSARPR